MRVLILVGMTLGALFLPGALLAHGTSEPGPHGGEIRMPGAFHVEALAVDGRLRVYLLKHVFHAVVFYWLFTFARPTEWYADDQFKWTHLFRQW